MPWCSNCKMEYIEGISVCPDCGGPLTDNKEVFQAANKIIFQGEELVSEQIAEFLDYSGIQSVAAGEPNENGYPVLVSEEDYDKAMKLVRFYLYKESEKRLSEESQAPEANQKAPAPYVKKADKYEDVHSSAVTLLAVGVLGSIFLIAKIAGFLPFSFGSASLLFDIVMGVIFIFFLVSGFSSLKRAKIIKGEITEEVTATKEITEWFLSEYTAASIDQAISVDADTPEELKYFQRTEYIKHEVNTRLTELDDSYLEDLTENLYHSLYETEATPDSLN